MAAQHEARELLRRSQQGHGRPIISSEIGDYRAVAVGNTMFFGKNAKTFIDILGKYIKHVLGSDWGNMEIAKPLENRHPILQWYDAVCRYQRQHIKTPGEITSLPMTGATSAYYDLAYNLYLLQHNVEVRDHLLRRLKNRDSFYGAYYESFVAAWFILAGFELTLENEEDSAVTHCEFTAAKSGHSYSVEAKTRAPNKTHLDVGNQLYQALKKAASHPRIVFIDLNVADMPDEQRIMAEVVNGIKGREPKLTILGQPAPPAYVFVTNQPYHLHLEDENVSRVFLEAAFKIPDFGHGVGFTSLIAAHKARQKHADVRSVFDACRDYMIPVSFDGEIPEFAFDEAERRFIVGERYEVEKGVFGVLTSGNVLENEKAAYLGFSLDDGRNVIYTATLSEPELSAYRQHPETFFGQVVKQGGKIEDPIDMFEFFREGFKNAPRERILEFFASAPDIDEISQLPDDELRLVYAERHTLSVMSKSETSNDQ